MSHTGYVYLWYDRKKKWFCLGSHFGNVDDNYITSTGFMLKAYRKRTKDFSMRVLEYYSGDSQKELLEREQFWLDKISDNELCIAENKRNGTTRYYNQKKTASGLSGKVASDLRKSYWNSEKGLAHKKRMSEEMKTNNPIKKGNVPWNKGKVCPSISEAKLGKNNPILSKTRTGKKYPNLSIAMTGRILSEEHKKNIAKARTGTIQSTDTKRKQSEAMLGVAKSDAHKASLSAAAIERSARVVTCPHCGFVGNGPVMNRWHFSNCRHSA